MRAMVIRSVFLLFMAFSVSLNAQDSIPCDYPLPDVPFLEASLCSNEPIQFRVIDSTGIFFHWADSAYGAQRKFYTAGMYVLRMGNGCETKEFHVFISHCDQDPFVPTAFSPNNDGVNDMFRARGPSLKWILLDVYNRKGEKVFTGKELSDFWDGNYQGREAPPGVYIWRLSAGMNSGRVVEMKGELVLIR